MATNCSPGTTSVIIPCWNQLDFTRQCIAALLRHTRLTWELVVVNNGSTDGTAEYLTSIQAAAPLPFTVVTNSKNRGFPAAINQGLQCARGEYLVLLNNDVVVTDGWLEQLIGLASMSDRKPGSQNPKFEEMSDQLGPAESHPYPGRNVTVIDLAPGSARGRKVAEQKGRNIGLVGPMSNYAAPPQLVESVPYRNRSEMEAFARQWRHDHRGKWMTVPKLSGFCLLVKRRVFDAIGGLDEQFGLGFFDDDDVAERARRAGFELALAKDLFVHHFGSRTFTGSGVDANRLLDENAAKFAAKWGKGVAQGHRVTLRPFSPRPQPPQEKALGSQASLMIAGGIDLTHFQAAELDSRTHRNSQGYENSGTIQPVDEAPAASAASPHLRWSALSVEDSLGSGPLAPADRARVSLTMIVRNEQKNLANCLGSVRGLFDEIVIVDTGSKDRTVEIARSFGAQVFQFAWIDDFAAARNVALQHATGNYAFWLDADDLLEPAERVKLEALLARLSRTGDTSAFVVRCSCDPGPGSGGGDTVVDHVRLFPILDGVRWTYKVHEQILPSLRRAGVATRWTDITVRHTGYADPEVRVRKQARDTRILMGELGERPNDPFIAFNLGMIAVDRGEWDKALGFLKRSLARSAPTDSITRKLYALIARVHEMLGDSEAALGICEQGLSLEPEDAELWFRKGVVHRRRGEREQAKEAWQRILTLRRPEKFASVNQGIYGHVTRRNLAALAKECGDREEAERQWRAVLAECPGDSTAMQKLLECAER